MSKIVGKKTVMYLRRSRGEQAVNLDRQRDIIRQWATRRFDKVRGGPK